MTIPPPTHYARAGDDHIAYQVVGEGPVDLVYLPLLGDCIDLRWEWPPYAGFLERLASFTRLIQFDRRGLGASDAVPESNLPTWELWADDVRAVLDAVGSERAAVLAPCDAGPVGMLFAATQPERTHSLILANTAARFVPAEDYPWGMPLDDIEQGIFMIGDIWGTDVYTAAAMPDSSQDPEFRQWSGRLNRLSCSPREAVNHSRWLMSTDVRSVLPLIDVPTLVLHREDCLFMPVDHGRHLAENIRGARLVEIPGREAALAVPPYDESLAEIQEFLTGERPSLPSTRVLAAVLFTDIVTSTERAARVGDAQWRHLLDSHDAMAAAIVGQNGGRLIKTTGDGVLATFDGAGRAIKAAAALRDALAPLEIEIRAGLHTGEVELRGEDIGGIAVHVAARVREHAQPGELLVSGVVPTLVAGSGLQFEERGEHVLKGIDGNWKLFAVNP